MNIRTRRGLAALSVGMLATFGVAACSDDSTTAESSDDTTTAMEETTTDDEMMTTEGAADPAANLVGPGCAGYAEQVPEGPGSVQGMAQDPVTVAASNNPMLSTLTQAVSGQLNPEVNLVDTLDGGEFTVFAPTNDAFAKIDPATLETLKTDTPLLTSILTYHVVPGQISPDDIVGTQTTVQGATVEVTGEGDELMVGDAAVVCGGVQTANATVYLIDSVLMPPQ
ncbi:MAG: fasciclin domain-containing protein [Rhodococcus sp.]|nr:fasciclin domain-containing protein [Rhodococcus sp. (in: high G+C Gram-positive bacteria)]